MPNDLDLLSAYLDDALAPAERAALEARLRAEPALRQQLEELRFTVAVLQAYPPLKAPRSFALTPAQAAAARRADRLLVFPTHPAFSGLAAAAAIALFMVAAVLLTPMDAAPTRPPSANVVSLPTNTSVQTLDAAPMLQAQPLMTEAVSADVARSAPVEAAVEAAPSPAPTLIASDAQGRDAAAAPPAVFAPSESIAESGMGVTADTFAQEIDITATMPPMPTQPPSPTLALPADLENRQEIEAVQPYQADDEVAKQSSTASAQTIGAGAALILAALLLLLAVGTALRRRGG